MIKIVLQEWFWCLFGVLWSEKSNGIITNGANADVLKGLDEGQ